MTNILMQILQHPIAQAMQAPPQLNIEESVVSRFLDYGLLGIAVLGSAYYIWHIQKQKMDSEKEMKKIISDMQKEIKDERNKLEDRLLEQHKAMLESKEEQANRYYESKMRAEDMVDKMGKIMEKSIETNNRCIQAITDIRQELFGLKKAAIIKNKTT